jgi:hypothetical protein
MNKRMGIGKAIAGVVVAGAITLTSLPGLAHADGGVGVGELQEVTISKSMDHTGGDVDGRDFLVWQRGSSPSSDDRPTEEVSFYYNKIVFNYGTGR